MKVHFVQSVAPAGETGRIVQDLEVRAEDLAVSARIPVPAADSKRAGSDQNRIKFLSTFPSPAMGEGD